MLFHSCTHKKGILQLNLWYISLFIKQPVSQSTGQGAGAQLLGSQPSGAAPAAAGAAANGSHLQPTISWVEPTCAWVTLPCTHTHTHTHTHTRWLSIAKDWPGQEDIPASGQIQLCCRSCSRAPRGIKPDLTEATPFPDFFLFPVLPPVLHLGFSWDHSPQ